MAGGNFLGRVIGYVVNELVVHGLADKFAVRTSKSIEEVSKKAAQAREQIVEQIKDAAKAIDSFKRS